MKHASRSVYVAQLRRAFLLRAHPDRFRRQSSEIRKQQSVLLQALSDRMMEPDFLDYTSNSNTNRQLNHPPVNNFSATCNSHELNHRPHLPFVLEKRDGSLVHNTLDLNSSVLDLLTSLADALHASGAAKLPPPPPMPSTKASMDDSNYKDRIHWARSTEDDIRASSIDHRYDVNTNRGRDLHSFLASIDPTYIKERQACRMDVSAAALVARRLFSLQSIDGISLGWSSESFLVILNSLIRLHEEHNQRLHVQSFYPLQLKFSSDEFRSEALDIYVGIIYLNPAATQLEWLESLQEVTESQLEAFSQNRMIMEERVSLLQEQMGVRVKKGYSCSSLEYHHFLESIVGPTSGMRSRHGKLGLSSTSSSLMSLSSGLVPFQSAVSGEIKRTKLVVESPVACRRCKVTEDGSVRLPSNTTRIELESALSKLSQSAHDRWQVEQIHRKRCKQLIQELQWELGVQKVFPTGVVPRDAFLRAMSRLLEQTSVLGGKISGYSLGIAGAGRFCSIADDGSLIIPFNWT
ncbi:protein of unknown function DUF4461 containing protein [Nitzschia inconspicua]|uniref:DUF4461 domain-containing protein n=1 Tax=Nitzschia inconspicua TaxID=303405 RepID=A0A9K3LPW6_9STRA|nr:protein of unknown function DUF4461 containing protein [Nitzschia inconspicua]